MFLISAIVAFIGPVLVTSLDSLMSLGGSTKSAGSSAISGFISNASVLLFLGSIILMLMGVIVALIQYRNSIFVLDQFSLKFHRGFLNQTEISIPYRQIQDIDLVRTIQHRLFGVSRLVMITAGHEEAKEGTETDTIFDPIDADLAEEIRTFLEKRIGVQVIEGTFQSNREEMKDEKSTNYTDESKIS